MAHEADMDGTRPQRPAFIARLIGSIAFGSGVLALALALIAPFGFRNDLFDLQTALRYLFAGALLLACIAVIMTAITLLLAIILRPRPGVILPVLGGVLGAALLFTVMPMVEQGSSVPAIHDITTDFENPPQFVDLVALRERDKAMNGPEYAGEEVAAQQREAYPDIKPLCFRGEDAEIEGLLRQAETVARSLGWDVKVVSPGEGRLEATQSTFWFNFTDDIVIRVVAREEGGVRMDIRSKSRFGVSDLGVNAGRIRAFTKAMADMMDTSCAA